MKQERWDELSQTFSRVGDRLGRGIDKGIFETVIALNALGIHTTASCEGHLDHGSAAPWVDIDGVGLAPLRQRVADAYKRAYEVNTREALSEAHELRSGLLADSLAETKKLFNLLSEFYTGREVPYEARLTLRMFGLGETRMENQGGILQEIQDIAVKEQKLRAYQQEMNAFTVFLKKKYFQGE